MLQYNILQYNVLLIFKTFNFFSAVICVAKVPHTSFRSVYIVAFGDCKTLFK